MDARQSLHCSSLSNIHRFRSRDLFRSHARRTGQTKRQVIAEKCTSWQPRPNPGTPYASSRPSTAKVFRNRVSDDEIQHELQWLRDTTNNRYNFNMDRPHTAATTKHVSDPHLHGAVSNYSTAFMTASSKVRHPRSQRSS